MMIWKSGPDAKCHYFNEAWLRFTGRPLQAELGDGWSENVHPEDVRRCRRVYLESFWRRVPFESRYRLQRHDRVYRAVREHAVPLFEGERFLGYVGACFELGGSEDAMRASAEATSNVAHDLRQSLASLALLMEAARRRNGEREEEAPFWRRLRTQVDRCAGMVEDLSDAAVIEQGRALSLKPRRLELGALLSGMVELFDAREQGGREHSLHHFTLALPDAPVWVEADARRLERVFTNLLDNARKYSPEGGEIRVTIERSERLATVRVSDPGLGLSEEALTRLSTRFFRDPTTAHLPGLGLGLSISREIVEAHGGALRFESVEGSGTTAVVTVPARPAPLMSSD